MAFLPRILLLFTIAALPLSISGRTIRKPPAIFVFGDSLADVGNNNHFNTSRANFPHNGIDFPGSIPTGRFSNGYNTIDWIAKHVGYKQSPPAYMSVTKGKQMLRGVNFASGGSGILDTTGKTITFTTQLTDLMNAVNVLEKEVGKGYTAELIKKSLFLISAGSNDMFSYYQATGAQNATMNKQFIDSLIDKYADKIKVLFKYGARKFGILGVSHIGCVPAMKNANPLGTCVEALTSLARDFNSVAKARMHLLKSELDGMNYSYGNVYNLMSIALKKPILFGYKNTIDACCGSGKFNGGGPCTPNATFCSNRKEYLFWDLFHPTQATSKFLAKEFYGGSRKFASPINLRSLIKR